MIIYKVTNIINNKVYIGKTNRNLPLRKKQHLKDANNTETTIVLHRALQRYGLDNFMWEIIETLNSEEDLNEREKFWINHYNSYINNTSANGYNMTLGGDGTIGYAHSEESKKKISKILKLNSSRGSQQHCSKLTEDEVFDIKEMIKKKVPLSEISLIYNVTVSTLSSLKSGNTWAHVGDDVSDVKYSDVKRSTLTEDDIKGIKELLKERKLTQKEISEIYGVSHQTIASVKSGNSWRNVGEDISQMKLWKNNTAKLTIEQVVEIKMLLRDSNLSQSEIAEKFNVASSRISQIKRGKEWKDVGLDVSELNKPKLTQEQIVEIRQLLKQGDLSILRIATMYGVGRHHIYKIEKDEGLSM